MDDEEQNSNMGPYDPYGKEKFSDIDPDIEPGFTKKDGDSDSSSEGGSGKRGSAVGESVKKRLRGVEAASAVLSGAMTPGGSVLTSIGKDAVGGLFGKSNRRGRGENKRRVIKLTSGFAVVMLIIIIPLMLLFVNTPLVLIGLLDYSFQDGLGWTATGLILDKQSTYIFQEALLKGQVPGAFANELADYGIEVGQLNIAGNFVRTNSYLANLDQGSFEVASIDNNYQLNESGGELVVRFKDKIIDAADFVATIESDPEMYAEYTTAANIPTKYFYSEPVRDKLEEYGISGDSFAGLRRTGDQKKDQELFEERYKEVIDKQSAVYINGYREDGQDGEGGSDNEVNVGSGGSSSSDMFGLDDSSSLSNIQPAIANGSSNKVMSSIANSSSEKIMKLAAVDTSKFTLLEGYGNVTFYGASAEENGGNTGLNGTPTINGQRLAAGQVAKDTRDGGALNYGDIIYIETTADSNAEGSYAHGKYFIVADTGGETARTNKWDIDVFADEAIGRLNSAPYGMYTNARVYKVASGVSWDDYLRIYANNTETVSSEDDGEFFSGVAETTESEEGFSTSVVGGSTASIIDQVGKFAKGKNATEKGLQLLSVAVSATEPIKAGAIYMATEEVLQSTRFFGNSGTKSTVAQSDNLRSLTGTFAVAGESIRASNGYGDAFGAELINMYAERRPFTYTDVTTGEEVTVYESFLEDDNLKAIVSGGGFNIQEAQNFQRDRVLLATQASNDSIINMTTLATNGQKKSSAVLKMEGRGDADMDLLSKAADPISIAITRKPSSIVDGMAGVNWNLGGGEYILTEINQFAVAALPSNASGATHFNREARRELARHAEAERAVKSPFDITSRYTFLGSIVDNLASLALSNQRSSFGNLSTVSVIGALSGLVSESTDSLLDTVLADGSIDGFADIFGVNCSTVNSVYDIEGGLYCTARQPISTKHYEMTQDDYDSVLDETTKKRLTLTGSGRNTTIGVKDGEVCEIYKKEFRREEEHVGELMWHSLSDLLSGLVGLYDSCNGVDDTVSLGSEITSSEMNPNKETVELFSAWARYDMVKSLMYDTKSEMATIRDNYYAENPRDESPEGRLARISGLSKEDARLAINYANYLTMLANYHPETRYAFGEKQINVPIMVEFIDDKEVNSSVYLAWFSKIEYSDVRNRSFVV